MSKRKRDPMAGSSTGGGAQCGAYVGYHYTAHPSYPQGGAVSWDPGLPHLGDAPRKFKPLKRRGPDSPPPWWECEQYAEWARRAFPAPGQGGSPRGESEHRKPRADISRKWHRILEPLGVGESITVRVSFAAAARAVSWHSVTLNRRFGLQHIAARHQRITRLE